jgi:large subunit ribosomal protein L22
MTGPKTNERPGTRATLRGYHMSASKARVVLNLVRGQDVESAREILAGTTREAAQVIGKVLASAVANAVNNDGLSADELYVSAAYADEGVTLKRFSPRARGRAGRIRKRSCHITVIVSRLDEERLEVLRAARNAQATASRQRRVASSRRRADQPAGSKRGAAPAEVVEADVDVESLEEPTSVDVVETDEGLDAGGDAAEGAEMQAQDDAAGDAGSEDLDQDADEETDK